MTAEIFFEILLLLWTVAVSFGCLYLAHVIDGLDKRLLRLEGEADDIIVDRLMARARAEETIKDLK